MTVPLHGRRVLDLSGEMGSYGARLLAELGADVVKVEPPGGDRQRSRPPYRPGVAVPESSLVFAYYNASKRGITLDATRPDALPLLAALAAHSDAVLVTASPQSPVAGLDPVRRQLSWAPNGAVVVCLSPFGLDGPYRGLRATHFTSYAMSGLMRRMGPPEGPPLAAPYQHLHDELALQAAVAVLVGLRERPVRGGQFVELSLHEFAGAQDDQLDHYAATFTPSGRVAAHVAAPPAGVWSCRDGDVELLVHNPPHWRGFVRLVGAPAQLTDPALEERATRLARREELSRIVADRLGAMTVEEVISGGQALGVPCAAVNTPERFVDDPQPRERGYWRTEEHPTLGQLRLPGTPFRATAPVFVHRGPAPMLGQHNADIYCGELGHDPSELDKWRASGLV